MNLLVASLLAWGLQAGFAFGQEPSFPSPKPPVIMDLPSPNCGLVTKYAGHLIPDGCLQEALNVTYTGDVGVQRRKGRAKFNAVAMSTATPYRRIYPFDATDGTRYIVAVSSDKIWQAQNAGSWSAITGLAGLSPTLNTSCTQGLGRLWCVNQTDGLFWWDGTSTAAVSAGPKGNLIGFFRNRIIIANVSGGQSQLYGSGFIDGTDWTTASQSTSPFIIRVTGINDGEKITCLMGTYSDSFIVGTQGRLFGLYGFDNNDFVLRELSRETGCLEPQSVQEHEGKLTWFSRRGIERMHGPTIDWKVSDPIQDILDPIVATVGNTVSLEDTTQSDFEAGNLTVSGSSASISATISPNNLVPSSWTAVDTSSVNFASGTLVNLSTGDPIGTITLSSTVVQDDFSDGDYTANPVWTAAGSDYWSISSAKLNYDAAQADDDYTGRVYTGAGFSTGSWTMGLTVNTNLSDEMYWDIFIGATASDPATTDGYMARFRPKGTSSPGRHLYRVTGGSLVLISSSAMTQLGSAVSADYSLSLARSESGNMTFFVGGSTITGNDTTHTSTGSYLILQAFTGISLAELQHGNFSADNVYSYRYHSSATFTSQIFDTAFSTPTWGPFVATLSSGAGTVATFQVRSSTAGDGGGFESLVAQGNNEKIAAAQRRYVRYVGTFSTVIASAAPTMSDASLTAATTGYFISQCRNPGTAISAWGLFACDVLNNDGSFSFAIATGATCNAATRSTATWNSQTNNTAIAIATAPFVAYRTLFSLDSGTQTPTMRSCTFNWIEGDTRPEVASAVYDHKYHLFYTTDTASGATNTEALVLDYRDRWAMWDNTPARSAAIFQRNLVIGDGASSGHAYRHYTSNADDGGNFTSKIRTKDLDLGNWRTVKLFDQLKIEVSPEVEATDNVVLTVNAYADKLSLIPLGSVNLDEDTGLIAASVPFPLDSQTSGRYISIEISNTGSQPWRYYRGALEYRPLREN